MRRLAASSLALVTVFALMMGVAMRVGASQALSARVDRLHLADCDLPCWNGITPGITPVLDAKARIDTLLPNFQGPATSATSNPSSSKFLIWTQYGDIDRVVRVVNLTIENDQVMTIGIGTDHTSEDMPRLGEVLMVFGSPTCVITDERSGFTNMYYENAPSQPALEFSVFPLALTTPVNNLLFGASNYLNCQNSIALSWHEFRIVHPLFFAPVQS